MIARIGERLARLAERWVPDPFVLSLVLSAIVAFVAVGFGSAVSALPVSERVGVLAKGWYAELWNAGLMKFALQMCIVLITGHAIATTKFVQSALARIASMVTSPAVAAFSVAAVACIASLIQWGLGAIVGALMAREMGRAFHAAKRPVHYPLLGAAGYAGFLVWHGGLSGSAPLKVAEPGHFLENTIGVIDVSRTLFGPLNLAVTLGLLVIVPVAFYWMTPKDEAHMRGYLPSDGESGMDDEPGPVWVSRAAAAVLFAFCGWLFWRDGVAAWNLDSINVLFFATGLAMHVGPMAYMAAVSRGIRGCAGIVVQFPIYFGILGLLKSSGLILDISEAFLSIATPTTYPVWTFLSAGVVNFFVPSGGGQWAVQGPVMVQNLDALGIEPERVVMAMAYGDAWTNMLQPFWALPLLGIMELRARDIMGYTTLILCLTGPFIMAMLVML
ncbi:MAG: TIGR00366 family protein [bacterium]